MQPTHACRRLSPGARLPCPDFTFSCALPNPLPSFPSSIGWSFPSLQIVPAVTELVVAELLWLDYDNPTKPIYLYINSPGTQVMAAHRVGCFLPACTPHVCALQNHVLLGGGLWLS